MSLKAKIEAVIYAAEEPVTLAQLSALFGDEVWESLAAALPDAALPAEAETGPENESVAELLAEEAPETPTAEPEPEPAAQADGDSSPLDPAPSEQVSAPETEPSAEAEAASEEAEPAAEEQSEASGAAPEHGIEPVAEAAPETVSEAASGADEKKAARQRERAIREEVRRLLSELVDDYTRGERGLEIREVAGGFRVATKPEYHDAVRAFVKSLKPPLKLSLQALETLAVIAYKQPITAPEVSEIRGVESAGVLGSLVSRKLIATAGRKQVIGRPILYKTTKEFLLRFGLRDLNELPSIEEFEKLASEIEGGEEGGALAALRARRPTSTLPFSEGSAEAGEALEANAAEAGVAVAEPPDEETEDEEAEGEAGEIQIREIEDIEIIAPVHEPEAIQNQADEPEGEQAAEETPPGERE